MQRTLDLVSKAIKGLPYSRGKGKGKVHPGTGHDAPDGE